MPCSYRLLAVALLLGGALACNTGPHASTGFRLPNGDAGRGKNVFLALECHRCHQVAGVVLPRTESQPASPVVLGGATTRRITDGYLTTSIINPQYGSAPGTRERVAAGAVPPMSDYADRVTARDLADLVAFLHGQYTETWTTPTPAYY